MTVLCHNGKEIAFNGAATFQLRIAAATTNNRYNVFPSMEPQLFSCGLGLVCFIAVIIFRTFNGAATFQLRIDSISRDVKSFHIFLQWSRNFSVADCCGDGVQQSRHVAFNGAATFQLRIAAHLLWYSLRYCPFNGAATFQLRIARLRTHPRSLKFKPSMEPQLFSCGLRCRWNTSLQQLVLQWSRNFSVADCINSYSITILPTLSFNGAATFQLRIAADSTGWADTCLAFNGAATFQLRIDQNTICVLFIPSNLQWSRNFSVADCIQS